jgi:hypothetical protein
VPRSITSLAASLLAVIACSRYLPDTTDTFTNDWYSGQLRAAAEPRLRATGEDREIFRLSWIPSFHPTVIVRVERNESQYVLVAKRLTGAGGYEPGKVGEQVRRPLERSEWNAFNRHLKAANFWSMQPDEPPKFTENGEQVIGTDGSQWFLEGASRTEYHFVDRWFIEDYPSYFRACLCLLALSGLPTADLEGYVGDERPGCE